MDNPYEIWLGETRFPVAPGKVLTKVKGNNKTINLINEAEVNQIKGMKLTDITFELLLPGVEYPFAYYETEFQTPKVYLDTLELLKTEGKPFGFKLIRKDGEGNPKWDTSMNVSLEDYEIKEDAEELFDTIVSIELKQYKKFGVRGVKVKKGKKFRWSNVDTDKKKIVKSYTTRKGDTLRIISRKVYGKDTLNNASIIYKKNKKTLDKALKSRFGGKYTKRTATAVLPAGMKLTIPQKITYLKPSLVRN